MAAVIIAAVSQAGRDEAMHLSYYRQYEEANARLEDRDFESAYETFKNLAPIYKNSYILHLKMAVCAMNLGLWEDAVGHSRRTLELRPALAKDEDFMHGLAYSFGEIGDTEAKDWIFDYYYNFAAMQK